MSKATPVLNDQLSLTEVQIWPVKNPTSRIKAMAAITFNGALRITGCRIIEGANGLFLSYPSEKKPGTDQFFPLFHPVDRLIGNKIQSEVINRFQAEAAV